MFDRGYVTDTLSPLSVQARRVTGSIVGRPLQIAAVQRALATAQSGLMCLTLEGEPGIGKTRMLLAIEGLAREAGFTPIAAAGDEEIREPFLIARGIFNAASAAAKSETARQAIDRVAAALYSMDDAALGSVTPERKVVRVFDLAAVALRALAAESPAVIMVDDLQWADEDSLRLLRYSIRTIASCRILLVLATRPDEVAQVNGAVTLMADLERMGLLERLKLSRFTPLESADFLKQVLGGPVSPSSASVMHAQAEGVPFILAEQARAYRDAGMVQQIDGVWTLARNAQRLLPSAVRTLIQRRASRLPEETRSTLAEAAILGRSFNLRDLRDVQKQLGDKAPEVDALAESLAPAGAAGLLVQHSQGSKADYTFAHELVREYAASTLSATRRRAIHAAIVQLLKPGDPTPASLPLLAKHAMAAGQTDLAAKFSVEAARVALKAHAAEEALRLIALAQPLATSVQDRIQLLCLQDDALSMLRRPAARLEGLAQLAALAEALGDPAMEFQMMLRRAAALRLLREYDRAADLARLARARAAEQGDRRSELAACLELGQDCLQNEIGEGYMPTAGEVDLEGAQEAFQRAEELAAALGDDAGLAAAVRELGIIAGAEVRGWLVQKVMTGEHLQWMHRVVGGETFAQIIATLPIGPLAKEATARLQRALELYEKLGDRRGVMSTVIALAFLAWGPDTYLQGGAQRIEEIRRLATRINSVTKESERALAEVQMVYGAHVYARTKGFPDAALAKGEEAYAAAQTLGERTVEFASAGGVALVLAEMGAFEEAERWLGRASETASAAPTPLRAWLLESWRGSVCALSGDAKRMTAHLQRAVQLGSDQGRPAARCESLARLALGASRLGSERADETLLVLAENAAAEAKSLASSLPGRPLWGAQAEAALATVALARGEREAAARAGKAAFAIFDASHSEDLHLEISLPSADAIIQGSTPEEANATRFRLGFALWLVAQRFQDEQVRVRWFRGPLGRELTRLAAPLPAAAPSPSQDATAPSGLHRDEAALLRLLVQGNTNQEIARALGLPEESVARRLAELFAKIGASSRAAATAVALTKNLI